MLTPPGRKNLGRYSKAKISKRCGCRCRSDRSPPFNVSNRWLVITAARSARKDVRLDCMAGSREHAISMPPDIFLLSRLLSGRRVAIFGTVSRQGRRPLHEAGPLLSSRRACRSLPTRENSNTFQAYIFYATYVRRVTDPMRTLTHGAVHPQLGRLVSHDRHELNHGQVSKQLPQCNSKHYGEYCRCRSPNDQTKAPITLRGAQNRHVAQL